MKTWNYLIIEAQRNSLYYEIGCGTVGGRSIMQVVPWLMFQ
jgi:hypothetical protein